MRSVYLLSFTDPYGDGTPPNVYALEDKRVWEWIFDDEDEAPEQLNELIAKREPSVPALKVDPASGSYEMDKAHLVARGAEPVGGGFAEVLAWLAKHEADVAGEYHGIYY